MVNHNFIAIAPIHGAKLVFMTPRGIHQILEGWLLSHSLRHIYVYAELSRFWAKKSYFCDERLELVELRINGQIYDKAVYRIYPMTSPSVNLSFTTQNSLGPKEY